MNTWTLLQMLGGIPGQREIFEEICRKIVKVEHPESHSPREHRGDHGIDIFVGDSATGVDVYQVKFFREQVGDTQRSQIRESYDKILDLTERVKSWTLMLPLELSYDEIRWFEGWKKKQEHDIRLISGHQLEEKLKRPKYREALDVLTNAFSMAGLQITWSERPAPILKVQFSVQDPYGSEEHRVVYILVIIENVGKRSVRNPKVTIHHSEQGIVALPENPIWERVTGHLGMYPLNPRVLETDRTIRPGERIEVLPIQYPLSRFRQAGIHCELLMDDDSPVQSGVTIDADEVPESGWKEKLGEENYFPVLTPCLIDPDPKQRLSPGAKEILDRIVAGAETREGKGVTVIRGFPSNNEAIACVFSLNGGDTIGFRRDEFESALEELIQVGFIMELDRVNTCIRYKLIAVT